VTTPRLAGHPAASQQAIVDAALLMLRQMGLPPDDLVTVARAYAGHTDRGSDAGATTTYVRATVSEYLPGTGNRFSCAGSYGSGISLTPSTAQRPPRHSSVL
jgi:hypothetical protein